MVKYFNECNYCGKLTDDILGEVGWINITGKIEQIRISGGRDKGGNANKYGHEDNVMYPLDFCCFKCLELYFERIEKSENN